MLRSPGCWLAPRKPTTDDFNLASECVLEPNPAFQEWKARTSPPITDAMVERGAHWLSEYGYATAWVDAKWVSRAVLIAALGGSND